MTLISSAVMMFLLRSWGEGYEYVMMSHLVERGGGDILRGHLQI